jgi:hypothetical protein
MRPASVQAVSFSVLPDRQHAGYRPPGDAASSGMLRYTGPWPAAGASSLSSNVIRFRKPSAAERSKGKTLCREGFHKWAIRQDKQFDVRQGRLVTVYACVRCGATKTEAR